MFENEDIIKHIVKCSNLVIFPPFHPHERGKDIVKVKFLKILIIIYKRKKL